jgi:hypothetical protein
MNDTDKAIERLQRERFQQKTPTERMRMGSSMFDTARNLMESGFSSKNPTWDRQTMRFYVFKAFYANDFTENQLQKIQAHFFPLHHSLRLK